MPDDYFNQVLLNIIDGKVADARCIVPGKVKSVDRAADRERDVTLLPGIGRRQAGDQIADGPVPSAPVMYPAGGGYSQTWPLDEGDECVGLVADRNNERWRQNREPGEAHSFSRSHDVSDAMILPVSITAPAGAPEEAGRFWSHAGNAGVAQTLDLDTGAIVITMAGTPAATITMSDDGEVVIEVEAGKSVKIGGVAAVSLAKNDALVTALDVFITALVAAGAGPTYAGAGAAQIAWDAVKNTFATLKAKGE